MDNSVNQVVSCEQGVHASGGVGTASGGAFDPNSIAGLTAWYKADVGTSTTTDGVAISQWNDQKGTNHLVQATGTNQPLYKAAIQNSKPGVLFDGTNDILDATGVSVTQPDTIFIVVKSLLAASPLHEALDGITNRQTIYAASGAGPWAIQAGVEALSSTNMDTAAHSLSAVFNGASSLLFLDGVSLSLGANPGAAALTGVRLGGFNTSTNPWNGYIFEVLVYNSGLSVSDRQSVESYIRTRWATP